MSLHFRQIALLASILWPSLAVTSVAETQQQTELKISPATTRITQPLDDQGFVDYVQAINDLAAQGVTPDTNYEVVVRQILGPAEISEDLRADYHRLLGIAIPRGDFFRSYLDFRQIRSQADAQREILMAQFDRLLEGPWSAAEHPEAARWLAQVNDQLDALVEGSRRPRNYTPYLSGDIDGEIGGFHLLSLLLPSAQQQREVVRSLRIRANHRIAAGDLDGAWEDIQAIYRVARLTGQGVTVIELLVGIAIDAIGHDASAEVLAAPSLTDEQARRFLDDLKGLSRLPSIAEKFDVGERFAGLDVVQTIARQRDKSLLEALELINDLTHATPRPPAAPLIAHHVVFQQGQAASRAMSANWNVTAELLNTWYDRLVAAAREESISNRREQFAAIQADMKRVQANFRLNPNFRGTPDQNGKLVGDLLAALLLPALESASFAEQRGVAQLEITRLAFAAQVHRRATGAYPATLAALAPAYLDEIPADPLSGEPFRYQPTQQGFLLYSVGRNGRDDGGRGPGDTADNNAADNDADDIAIRLPLAAP